LHTYTHTLSLFLFLSQAISRNVAITSGAIASFGRSSVLVIQSGELMLTNSSHKIVYVKRGTMCVLRVEGINLTE